ncbi:DUF5320 domain-containing protein [Maribellus mangrovi]|uniref:DUF5320 domain-containing protein n=1 Tax=Maribellus mangrovi TaxID=3133146 RepID=UPI0030EDE961
MPGFNGTGPKGEGPLTGRRQGRCREEDQETTQLEDNSTHRRGFRMRFRTNEQDEMKGQGRNRAFGSGRRRRGPGRGLGNRFGNRK